MSITFLILLCLVFAFQVFCYLKPRRTESSEIRFGLEALEKEIERSERGLREEIALSRQHSLGQARQDREELSAVLTRFNDLIVRSIETLSANQKVQLEKLMEMNERKLEQMRTTVDEKLQGTLEKRLGESFKLVSERLELVHKGLGEMQGLAVGVGDLKRVLTNVKTRGSWGEVQLEALLSELLTPSQYDKNVKTNSKSDALVEFAIRLPGRGASDSQVYLPVDSKYPIEDYQRLLDAMDKADAEAIEEARLNLERRIKGCAKDINSKYINPPETTDFGIMFLPTEGLYAEVVRRAGLMESLQRDYIVVLSGPATFVAFLN
ncbi:MAG: DNA recombination protein RmuC, partial [Deltaproteobacteria bacterium]|nr:DNA recombination protein RmuC [Deltaproteobacteria bacterium]